MYKNNINKKEITFYKLYITVGPFQLGEGQKVKFQSS